MNRITLSFSIILILMFWACAGTENETKTAKDPVKDGPEMEVAKVVEPASSSDGLYEVKVLKGDIPSPMKQMTTSVGGTKVVIVYGSPSAKDRVLYGDLVPYDAVWRTGANEATTFEASSAIKIEGKELPAGKYGLFSIPGEQDWTIIFNSVSDQWGAYEYKDSQDVLRVKVIPQSTEEMSETMEFSVKDGKIVYHWGKLQVPFSVAGA
ncbi:MAG: DUF2911 domain-containing protein [Bacteroidota bacterium]